jgi:hypothetical protein
MKKHTEKPPIDELFARKLGNMSLPPSPDGFERLQVRMGQYKPEARVIFWRNPDGQRYMAVAACLLLVCLFGWLYWPSGQSVIPDGQQVATNQSAKSPLKNPAKRQIEQSPEKPAPTTDNPAMVGEKAVAEQVGAVTKTTKGESEKNNAVSESTAIRQADKLYMPERSAPTVAQTIPDKKRDALDVTSTEVQPANKQPEQVADNKPVAKPAQVSERVLDVTIAEPESLVAARQIATESVQEKPVVAAVEKQPKEAKGFWQQVKRIKQGEVFARHDNPSNEERGLLGRAYSGLRQSFDKDKSAKQ